MFRATRIACVLLVVIGLSDCQSLRIAAAERPNILFILGDNWSYPHASILGDRTAKTPAFDRLAREGILLTHAFCPVPSCSPTRSSLLTGRPAHQLESAASLWGDLPARFVVFPELLRDAGYFIGYGAKGWGPGDIEAMGRSENPAGPLFGSPRTGMSGERDRAAEVEQDRNQSQGLRDFMQARPKDRPFFYWQGFTHPGRPTWREGAGREHGIDLDAIQVPACLPDVAEVREALADYYASVLRLDKLIGDAIALLDSEGVLESTLIVCCGDNGWQMPRGLANVYDIGCRVPMAVRWPEHVKPGTVSDQFVSLTDLAPTFLEVAGVEPPAAMTGKSLIGLLEGKADVRDAVFLERERHANVREGHLTYPMRAIRTRDFLYIRNLRPGRWPAGDPVLWYSVGDFGDVDDSAAKQFILAHRDAPEFADFFRLSFAKRPAEELYDLRSDPDQLNNVAKEQAYSAIRTQLAQRLRAWMVETEDPRVEASYDAFDDYPYYGGLIDGARGGPKLIRP